MYSCIGIWYTSNKLYLPTYILHISEFNIDIICFPKFLKSSSWLILIYNNIYNTYERQTPRANSIKTIG